LWVAVVGLRVRQVRAKSEGRKVRRLAFVSHLLPWTGDTPPNSNYESYESSFLSREVGSLIRLFVYWVRIENGQKTSVYLEREVLLDDCGLTERINISKIWCTRQKKGGQLLFCSLGCENA
jgi:hypothetical protein